MSAATMLISLAPAPRWQRLVEGRVAASGDGWPPPEAATPMLLAVPGEDVALHWLDLPDLAPAQASAAARLALSDRLAEADPHIAVASGSAARPVAVVARTVMAQWLAEAARAGWTPAAIFPDPLLLPVPADGWAVTREGNRVLARRADAAFAGEAALAEAIIGEAPVTPAAPTLPDPLPINLLVGDFAPVSAWQPPPDLLRRLALLAAVLAGLWLAGDMAALLRARRAVAAADTQMLALARPLLPAAGEDAADALTALKGAARQRGADGGLAALAGPLAQAVAQRPGAALASLSYTPAGGLVAGVAGGAGEAQALAAALAADGLAASAGTTRATADGSITDMMVRKP